MFRYTSIVLATLVFFATHASSEAGLLAHYRLDETSAPAIDSTGNTGPGNQAGGLTYGVGTVPAGTFGAITVDAATAASFNTSIDFDDGGIGNFGITNEGSIRDLITANGSGGTGQMTVMAWINPADSGTDEQTIFSSGEGAGGSNSGWKFTYAADPGRINFVASGADFSGSSTGIPDSEWSHVAVTYNNGSIEYFFNGVSIATDSWTAFTEDSAGEVKIGGRNGGVENFDGLLDEVKVFDMVLTAEEIQLAAINGTAATANAPEPSTLVLAAMSICGLGLVRRRRRC